VFSARPLDGFPRGTIGMSTHQRTWAEVGMRDAVKVELYDQFNQGGSAYLGSSDIEVGFASASKRTEVPYDQDDLAKAVIYVSLVLFTAIQRDTNATRTSKTNCLLPVKRS